jgi:hypothetical protein
MNYFLGLVIVCFLIGVTATLVHAVIWILSKDKFGNKYDNHQSVPKIQ